ncbi:hypothetical protein OGATHE_005106 [Ogataea polymorpha]|uniref:Uncharacterized protein n=1 Tax=Ogataea polymorpha TaxID=460523 RepID=A0A9P8NWL2_9ASCO|nr:hypothetical protein OGATHE_005106 [Ogataea polymorpha]
MVLFSFFTNHRLHGSSVPTNGVLGVKLVTDITVVFSGHSVTNGTFHQSRERWQHIDRWIHSPVRELSIHKDLPLGNISRQVRNRVSDIVVRHGQNWNLGNGSVSSFHTTSSLVDSRQVSIHITRISSSTWHFFSCGRHLSQSVGIRRHIRQNGQHMLFCLVGKIFGSSQRQSWCNDSFDSRVVSQVQEQRSSIQRTVLFEILFEETRRLQVDTHGGKNNTEILLMAVLNILGWSHQSCLSTNLGCDFIVRKTRSRENRDFLSSGDGVHGVDSRNTSGNHLLWVDTSKWIDRRSVDVKVVFSKHTRAIIDRSSRTIKDSTEHVLRDGNLQIFSRELDSRLLNINS